MFRVPRRTVLFSLALLLCVSSGLAQTGGATRIEENDRSITYSGTWYANSSPAHSGGEAILTNAAGARAAITFNGTGITWIGLGDGWAGIARVYLDGVLSTVDTYSSFSHYQRTLYTVGGLTPGAHTLSIEVLHARGPNTEGSWVWIDAFEIENGSATAGGASATGGRIEQNNPALIFTGPWFPNSNPGHSGGSAVLAADADSRATISFTGVGITWITFRDPWSGIANVYLDGALKSTVDNFASTDQPQSAGYGVTALDSGSHTLTIEVTGTRNPASGGSWIWVDGFEVSGSVAGGAGTPPPSPALPPPPPGTTGGSPPSGGGTGTRIEQNGSDIVYTGAWYPNSGGFNSGGSAVMALEAGSKATVSFRGTGIRWIGMRDEWSGIAKVYVDGEFRQQTDTYLTPGAAQRVIFQIDGLAAGAHTLTIEAAGTANPASGGAWVWVDAFEVTP